MSGLLARDDRPPLPHQPRKALLAQALAGLGRSDRAEAVTLLRRALMSPDPDVRTWAVAVLGRVRAAETVKPELLAALEDPEPAVVREAADALLRRGLDCGRELGARYRDQLSVYAALTRYDWDAVERVGPVALP